MSLRLFFVGDVDRARGVLKDLLSNGRKVAWLVDDSETSSANAEIAFIGSVSAVPHVRSVLVVAVVGDKEIFRSISSALESTHSVVHDVPVSHVQLEAGVYDCKFEQIDRESDKRWATGEAVQDWRDQWHNCESAAQLIDRPLQSLFVPLCGASPFLAHAVEKGVQRAVAIDFSEVALQKMRAHFPNGVVPTGVQILQHDIFEWASHRPNDAPKFDLIFDKDAFGFLHPSRRQRYVEMLTSVLRPGGLVYLEAKLKKDTDPEKGPPYHVTIDTILRHFSRYELVKEFGAQRAPYETSVQMAYALRLRITLPFTQVDVFSSRAFFGNALAVVQVDDASLLSTQQMQSIARWTNLAETTFLLPGRDECDYQVRIFCTESEMQFAGHPTLGTFAVHQSKAGAVKDRYHQLCGVGRVALRREGRLYHFAVPPARQAGVVDAGVSTAVCSVLGLSSSETRVFWADVGVAWAVAELPSASALASLKPSSTDWPANAYIAAIAPSSGLFTYEVRAFCRDASGVVIEDPVTGSLAAGVARHLFSSQPNHAKQFMICQGRALGRRGEVHISQDEKGVIWVGGEVTVCIKGEIEV